MTAGAPTKIEHLGSADEDAWVGCYPIEYERSEKTIGKSLPTVIRSPPSRW
jgi:hypothetical protein